MPNKMPGLPVVLHKSSTSCVPFKCSFKMFCMFVFYHVGPWGWTWATWFGGKLLHRMSHLHGPFFTVSLFSGLGKTDLRLVNFFIMLWAFPGSSLTPDLEAVRVPPDFLCSLAISARSAWPPHILIREHPFGPHVVTMHERHNCLGISTPLPPRMVCRRRVWTSQFSPTLAE